MRSRHVRLKQLFVFAAADALGALAGLLAAYYLRFSVEVVEVTKGYQPADYGRLLPIALLVWIFWMEAVGAYAFRERAFNLQILRKVCHANVLAVMTIICLHFFQRTDAYSRAIYPLALLTCTASMALARLALDRGLAHMRRSGRLPRATVLVLGTGPLGATIAKRIAKHAYLGLEVVGFVAEHPEEVGGRVAGVPIVACFGDVFDAVRRYDAAEVIVAQPDLAPQDILHFMLRCERELVAARIVPNLLEASLVEMSVEQIDTIPLFGLKESPLQGWNLVLKRLFDVVLSAVGLLAISPLLAALAAAVRRSGPGPILYRQQRVGIDGRAFAMLKFRTMEPGAEDETGPVWAVPGDDRATRIGAFLRRWNLDELPQLWNVLRGDMSLVGPRPERPHFVEQFLDEVPRYMGRHRVKAGMTGWAQVNGLRGQTSIEDRIKHDLYYVENWSIWLDVKILLMTFRATENAY